MSDVETLLKATIYEMEKLLASKTVVGEPITAGEKTVVPLLSVGAGFGAGAGSGKGEGEGSGGGAGGGFGMKPVAVIVIEKDDVRLERVKEAKVSLAETVLEKVPSLIKKEMEEREKEKEEKKQKEGKGGGKVVKVE